MNRLRDGAGHFGASELSISVYVVGFSRCVLCGCRLTT